jgi:hypothetical protein
MKLTNTLIQKITKIVADFPPEKHQEVLNYVEFLQSKFAFYNLAQSHHQAELSWDEFIQRTYGSCADDPIVIDEEGISDEFEESNLHRFLIPENI